jgi:cobalt-zinc-cadmium efflux system outer membrane protein
MTMKPWLLVLLSWLCLGSTAWCQTSSESPLTVDACVALALERHPLLQASQYQYQASLARVNQARALPQPTFAYDSDLQPNLLNFGGSGESYLGFAQTIEFPGRRSLRTRIARSESDIASVDIEILRLDLRFQVKRAFYGLLHAQERLRSAQQDLELSESFLKTTEVKFGAGDIGRVEVLRARVEAAQAANTVRAATSAVRFARAALNVFLGRTQSAPLEIAGELRQPRKDYKAEELQRLALSSRPEIKRINLAVETEALRKTEATRTLLPNIDLGVSRHRLKGEPTTWDIAFLVSVPLFFRQPLRGPVAEAQANIDSLRREVEQLNHAIGLEVEEAYTDVLTASNQIQLFEDEILKEAEEAYNMFQFSYQEGEIGGLELVTARRTLVSVRLAYADALLNYAVALAAVEKAVGQ